MRAQIIYVGTNDDAHWLELLRTTTKTNNCSLEVVPGSQIRSLILGPEVALVLMDAGQVPDLLSTISGICQQYADIPIVVLSAAPRWHEARNVLDAGAIDYQLKPSKASEIRQLLERALKHQPAKEYK